MIQAIKLSQQNSKHDVTYQQQVGAKIMTAPHNRKWEQKPGALIVWMRLSCARHTALSQQKSTPVPSLLYFKQTVKSRGFNNLRLLC